MERKKKRLQQRHYQSFPASSFLLPHCMKVPYALFSFSSFRLPDSKSWALTNIFLHPFFSWVVTVETHTHIFHVSERWEKARQVEWHTTAVCVPSTHFVATSHTQWLHAKRPFFPELHLSIPFHTRMEKKSVWIRQSAGSQQVSLQILFVKKSFSSLSSHFNRHSQTIRILLIIHSSTFLPFPILQRRKEKKERNRNSLLLHVSSSSSLEHNSTAVVPQKAGNDS